MTPAIAVLGTGRMGAGRVHRTAVWNGTVVDGYDAIFHSGLPRVTCMTVFAAPARFPGKVGNMSLIRVIDTYCASWSDQDAQRRRTLLLSVWDADATYSDPMAHANSADELLAHIAGIQARYPGARIIRTSDVDIHHGVARFAWKFVLPDGSSFPEGLDIAFLDADQQHITRIIGFFGPLAAI